MTNYNIYFYSFDLKNIIKSNCSEVTKVLNTKAINLKKFYKLNQHKEIYIKIIEKINENKFILCGYDHIYDKSEENNNNEEINDNDDIDESEENDNISYNNKNESNENNDDDYYYDDDNNSLSFQYNISNSWLKIYNIINQNII